MSETAQQQAEYTAAELERIRRKVDSVKGPGVTNGPDFITIGAPPAGRRSRVFSPGLNTLVIVKIVSNASGGGKYNGRVWQTPTADISATGNLAATEFGSDPGANDALVLNLDELAQSTHDLTTGTPKVTHFLGKLIRTNSDGTKVIAINGQDWENCS